MANSLPTFNRDGSVKSEGTGAYKTTGGYANPKNNPKNGGSGTFATQQEADSYSAQIAAAAPPPVVPVNIDPIPTTTSDLFAQPAKSAFDINALIAENRKIQQAMLSAYTKPDKQMTDLQQKIYDNQNAQRDTQLNAQAGLNKIEGRGATMDAIVGQSALVQKQANLQLQTLAFQQQPLVQQMEVLSAQKAQMLKAYELALSFGKDDLSLAMQLQQIQKQESNSAKQFAMENGVEKPFYTIDGKTIYRTSDGKAYSTLEEWKRDGGQPDLIQTVSPQSEAPTDDIAEYEYAVSTGYTGSFTDYMSEGGPGGPTPRRTPTPKASTTFTKTQLAKGAAAAGMAIEDFSQLETDEQNSFINGSFSDLVSGRLTDDDFADIQDQIDDMAEDDYSKEEIKEWLLSIEIPAEDRYELEEYAEEAAPEKRDWLGWFR